MPWTKKIYDSLYFKNTCKSAVLSRRISIKGLVCHSSFYGICRATPTHFTPSACYSASFNLVSIYAQIPGSRNPNPQCVVWDASVQVGQGDTNGVNTHVKFRTPTDNRPIQRGVYIYTRHDTHCSTQWKDWSSQLGVNTLQRASGDSSDTTKTWIQQQNCYLK